MLTLFLWLRYLRKKKIVLLSIAAVALSVALLIVVNSLFTGFINKLKTTDPYGGGDLGLHLPEPVAYAPLVKHLSQLEEVRYATPYLTHAALIRLASGDVRQTAVEGIDVSTFEGDRTLRENLLLRKDSNQPVDFSVGTEEKSGGWIGINILAEPNEKTDLYDFDEIKKMAGQQVLLITTAEQKPENTQQQRTSKFKRKVYPFKISDIYHSGVYMKDETVYLPYDVLYKIVYGKSSDPSLASRIHVYFKPNANSQRARTHVLRQWGSYAKDILALDKRAINNTGVSTRQMMKVWMYEEIYKQMNISMMIFSVICSVTILLVFCIFYMIVETRLKDIAIIKSCGASSFSAANIFLGFGGCVGLAGSVLGIGLGYLIMTHINTIENWIRIVFGLKIWRSSVYIFENIPDTVNWSAVTPIVIAAVAGCLIGALIPAVIAARSKPVEILRYE